MAGTIQFECMITLLCISLSSWPRSLADRREVARYLSATKQTRQVHVA